MPQVMNVETVAEICAGASGTKVARRQLDIRMTLPLGMVKMRSSGRLPSTAPASSMAMNRGIGTVRD